ncbi:helix-turn-helix domain-containing protein [Sessilibacter sp. MAH4]
MYNQLTYEERVTFSTLKLQGLSIRKIATLMGRHFSTLYRELKRNCCYVTDSLSA